MSKGRHIRKVKQRPACARCGGPLRQRNDELICSKGCIQ